MAANKRQLSSNLLKMKFMERTRKDDTQDEVQEQTDSAQHKRYLCATATTSAASKRFVYEHEPSYEVLEELVFGRLSFRGFNPEVERLMQYFSNLKKGFDQEILEDEDVDAVEMIERIPSMASNVAKRFLTKRQRTEQGSVPRFKKPKID